MRSWLLSGLWMVLLAAVFQAVSLRAQRATRQSHQQLEPVPLSQLDPRLIDIASLGYRGLYDDFLTIWLVQIFSDPQTKQADPARLNEVLQIAARQHPKLESVYMLSCFVMTFDMKHPEYCEGIATEGLKALPDSWRVPATLGYVAAFKLLDPAKGALYYGMAASRPNAPAYFKSFSEKLAAKGELTPAERQQAMQELMGKIPGIDGAPPPPPDASVQPMAPPPSPPPDASVQPMAPPPSPLPEANQPQSQEAP